MRWARAISRSPSTRVASSSTTATRGILCANFRSACGAGSSRRATCGLSTGAIRAPPRSRTCRMRGRPRTTARSSSPTIARTTCSCHRERGAARTRLRAHSSTCCGPRSHNSTRTVLRLRRLCAQWGAGRMGTCGVASAREDGRKGTRWCGHPPLQDGVQPHGLVRGSRSAHVELAAPPDN
eukprot:7381075-Prymnesium_polylepis.3